MKAINWFITVTGISILSLFLISVSGCSILADALKGDTKESSTDPTTEAIPQGDEQSSPQQIEAEQDAPMQASCIEPNEAEYIYGEYQVGWTIQGSRYEGILQMDGDSGAMGLKFFDPVSNMEDSVVQKMVLENCPQGLVLLGMDPRVPDTGEQHSTYAADNIFIRRETNGEMTLLIIDDQGLTSPLELQEISK